MKQNDGITNIAGNDTEQDLKGNLTEYETNDIEYEMEYDLDNRINSVRVTDRIRVRYHYDAFGRRVLRRRGSNATAPIWRGTLPRGYSDGSINNYGGFCYSGCNANLLNDLIPHNQNLNINPQNEGHRGQTSSDICTLLNSLNGQNVSFGVCPE